MEQQAPPYELKISRLTVDKLGVKLYDKVSAVVAELVANGYDADAERVTVRLPLNSALARRHKESKDGLTTETVEDGGHVIEVEDDGHGMTPAEAISSYLRVGRNRRETANGGAKSRAKHRPVMGRKGIGKLAPFGICQRIEVISAGGERTEHGFEVAHFFIDYAEILKDTEEPVPLSKGELDRTYKPNSGTIVRLSNFLPKRVPDFEVFHRQLATRFVFAQSDFRITIEDTRDPQNNPATDVSPIAIAKSENTTINLENRPVPVEEGQSLPVRGWLAMAATSYKNEELAGVRIYARNKIVATTRDFEQPAGFTGEFTIRSYLVGEVHADWLDLDDGEDLVRSDRQGILWDSDYGRALREWGAALIKEIGSRSKEPRRKRVRDIFMSVSKIEDRAKDLFPDGDVAATAIELGQQIGSFAAEDELRDEDYVNALTEVILAVAPHKALIKALQDFGEEASGIKPTLESMIDLFGKARIAEMASYSQIAAERVTALKRLESIVLTEKDESLLQELITKAPWLVAPSWTVITANQWLKTFKTLFEEFYHRRTGEHVVLAIDNEKKRPDFTLVNLGRKLHIVEIKAPQHNLNDDDVKRLLNYLDAFDTFFADHKETRSECPEGYQVDLIVDGFDLKESSNRRSLAAAQEKGTVVPVKWFDFLQKAKKTHEQILAVSDAARAKEIASNGK